LDEDLKKALQDQKPSILFFCQPGNFYLHRHNKIQKHLLPGSTIRFLLQHQKHIEEEALELWNRDRDAAVEFLTKYSYRWQEKVVDRAWLLSDELWTKYDELF